MPILILLLLAAACLDVGWPNPGNLEPRESLRTTLLTLGGLLSLSSVLSLWVVRTLARDPDSRREVIRRYAQARRVMFFVNVGFVAGIILALGWANTVWTTLIWPDLTPPRAFPFAELLVPAPYIFLLVCNWIIYYPAERAIHASGRGASARPEFWTLPAYLLFNLRQFALMIVLPLVLFTSQQSLARYCPEWTHEWWYHLLSLCGIIGLFLILPRLVKPWLGLQQLPEGDLRQRLLALSKAFRVRLTDLLLWPTRGAVANAMIIGVMPQARYVILTDRLLEQLELEELDAVFGHEIGHAKHGHIPYYAGFFLLSGLAGMSGFATLLYLYEEAGYSLPEGWQAWLPLPPLIFMAVHVFVIFGWISRICERQADIAGCRAASFAIDPKNSKLNAINAAGVRAMLNALDRVSFLNGHEEVERTGFRLTLQRLLAWIKAWQHGPIRVRIHFLSSLLERPELAPRHDRFAFRVRLGVILVLMAVIGVSGAIIGWSELWKRL